MRKPKLVRVLFLLLCICLNLESPALAITKLIFGAARSKFNPDYLSNFTIYALNESVYADLNLVKRLERGFKARIDIQLRLRNSKRYQTLLSYDFDVCATVIALKETLLKKWFKSLLKYGNFMENCPVNVGHYYLKGWHLEPAQVPTYLYPGDYRGKGHGYYGKYKSKSEIFVVDMEIDAKLV